MKNRNRRLSMVFAVIGGPLLTFAAAILLVPNLRSVLRSYDIPILLIVVLVSVIIYQISVAVFDRLSGDDG